MEYEIDAIDASAGIFSGGHDKLAKEFQKWNGRYNSLEEGPERESAQNILNRIGEARKKYNVS